MPMKLRVVVFEDDDSVRDFIGMLVKSYGHEELSYREPTICPLYSDPVCRCSREEACADILVTDNHMPNMTGLEFIRRQSVSGCKGVMKNKAVISGAWSDVELHLAKSLGCKIFTKPIDIDEFVAWLKKCEETISHERKPLTING